MGKAAFIDWVRQSLIPIAMTVEGCRNDLERIGEVIGDARLVALSEGTHGAAEPLEFRNWLLEYLVETKGFTAIAIESGVVESRAVHDYVRGDTADLARALAEGLSWTFDRFPQNESLIRWLRQYNENPKHGRKVNFYGFDVPGSPGNPRVLRGLDTALSVALEFLEQVDGEQAARFHARVDLFMPPVRNCSLRPAVGAGYDKLSQSERDALTAAVADLIALLERREARYIGATSSTEYEWAYRAAIGARQVDNDLRETPLDWYAPGEWLRFLTEASNNRDRAQADNVEWIVRQEGPAGKMLIFAHNGHLATAPYYWRPVLDETDGTRHAETAECLRAPAGSYLRRWFGARLVTIGNLIGSGEAQCADTRQTLERAPSDSIVGLVGEAFDSSFLCDLRSAPASIARWLNQRHRLGRDPETIETAISTAFDALLYIDKVTAAA